MAQTSSSSPAASLRRPAIAAARGTVLATHAAAGLATSVDREAARMLRASEGLARAAVARLEQAGRRPVSPPTGVPGGGAGGAAGVSPPKGDDAGASGRPKKRSQVRADAGVRIGQNTAKVEMKEKKRKRRKKKSGKGASNDEGKGKADTLMTDELADVRGGPVAPLQASALPFIPVEHDEFNDGWADGVGTAVALPAAGHDGCEGPPDRPGRVLVARRSGSRSPRRADELQQPDSGVSPLVAGDIASIKTLVKRPDFDQQLVRLVELDVAAGRWLCVLRSKERLRITPDNLQSVHPAFQDLAEQKFKAAVL
jgi:hypothetical protein